MSSEHKIVGAFAPRNNRDFAEKMEIVLDLQGGLWQEM